MKFLVRPLLIAAGTLCVGLGVLGIFLPLIPTTPLLLLGAACYVRSSEKLYNRLLSNKWLGPYIRDFREGRGIPMKAKVTTILILWATITASAVWGVRALWVRILLLAIALGVSVYLLFFLETRESPGR